jgi:thymidylate synthase (FAD)
VGKPRLEWTEFARFARDESLPEAQQYMIEPPSDGETLAELGGRLCYMSFGKGRKTNAQYLANIIGQQHFSVLEHANYSFIFTGVSRSLTHELVRHRHFSFSQLSQRYVDHSMARIVIPAELENTPLGDLLLQHAGRSQDRYHHTMEELSHTVEETNTTETKRMRGVARAFLLESTETKIMVTGNARTWREFIVKRNSPHADREIRDLASAVLEVLTLEAPHMFGDLT